MDPTSQPPQPPPAPRPVKKILAANRGEIAIRVFRAATELGIGTMAIYSAADRLSLHRYKADEAYLIGEGKGPVAAYLGIEEIVDLARAKGADAIHPGYGFLAENPEFAEACESAGIAFIGPTPEALRRAGDKVEARAVAAALGLPVIPGTPEPVKTLAEARRFAAKVGYPIMVKAARGGGGRGIRAVRSPRQLEEALSAARREAQQAFGDSSIFLEKMLERPKHVEVQILGDGQGGVVHLFERDCSIQRRHQKVVEIAPCILLDDSRRRDLCDMAVRFAGHLSFRSAGTVEFLMDASGAFYFIEVNPRIQVEHTVTEVVTGIDIVQAQIRIAEGRRLDDPEVGVPPQEEIAIRGAAIQCRITTENPAHNFIPDHGKITAYRSASGFGIRLDAGSAFAGAVITPFYDSLLVKVTAWGRTFPGAVRRMLRTLAEFRVRGISTNLPFLDTLIRHPEFQRGRYDTGFIERHPELQKLPERRDRATKLISFLGNVVVNGNPIVGPGRAPPAGPDRAPLPTFNAADPLTPGSRDLLRERGPEGFARWMLDAKRLLITDTTFRDAHQSLLATRMRTIDLLHVAPAYAHLLPELLSLEMWGGATFDTAMRFLREDPWERLARLREAIPNICFQMLLRGANAVGYANYPPQVVRAFTREAAAAGIDIFRIFDSLNWVGGLAPAIEAVREAGAVAEAAICYTGDIDDPQRSRYNLQYYLKLARDLEKRGANVLGIKDMAGLLKPYAASRLFKALKEEVGIPVHFHTHDTSGIQASSIFRASDAGVDAVDLAIASMSGSTSQVNLNSVATCLQGHPRDPGLDLVSLSAVSDYFEEVRRWYYPFESELRSGTAEVYQHEMPGGQYSNLKQQAAALGLANRWGEVKARYIEANRLLGDIVKVTPSSKIVGDLALFMVSNGLTTENIYERGKELAFPESVVGFFQGRIGRPPFGFPRELREVVLRHRKPPARRAGPSASVGRSARELEAKLGRSPSEREVLSYLMYPDVFLQYERERRRYDITTLVPTRNFLFGMEPGEEIAIEIEPGKTVILKLGSVGAPGPDGVRKLVFEVNGVAREIGIEDVRAVRRAPVRPKADPADLHQVAATMPGVVAELRVKHGDAVEQGDPLLVLEAMKMQINVAAPIAGTVKDLSVARGESVEAGDLLLTFE
jgi:pyruvate carboxylase